MAAARSGCGCCSGRSTPPPAALTTTTPPTTRRWQPNGGWRSWSPPRGLPLVIAATQTAHREPLHGTKPDARMPGSQSSALWSGADAGPRACRPQILPRTEKVAAGVLYGCLETAPLYSEAITLAAQDANTGSQAEARTGRGPGEHARPRIPLASCRPGSRPMQAARITWAAVVASWARPHTLGVCRARAVARWPV